MDSELGKWDRGNGPMSTITVRLYATLRDLVGAKEISVPLEDGATVRDLIEAIKKISPELGAKMLDEDGQLTRLVHIFVDGRNVLVLEGLDTPITPNAQVNIFPPVAGG
jgi:molybdopterin synthase sulfur carrier subunit